MSVRSFHSVFMATAVAGAALGCYLVSLRVASERAALEQVEEKIVLAQRDIRTVQTEIGTRARLAQLERWNVTALALSAPTADQILGDKFQLARLVRPERKLDVEAPVVLASAPAPRSPQPFSEEVASTGPASSLLQEASLKTPERETATANASPPPAAAERKPAAPAIASGQAKKAGDKKAKPAIQPVTRSVRTAKLDPLAPLPAGPSTARASRTNR